jgi:hypothetical protein
MLRCLFAGALVGLISFAAAEIRWYGNYDRAMAAAKSGHKVVLLDLSPPSGGPGGSYDAGAYADPGVQRAVSALIPLRLQVAKDGKALARRFQVATFPTVLILAPNGSPIWRISGPTGQKAFIKRLEKGCGMLPGLASYVTSRKGKSGTVDALAGAAIMAASANEIGEASALVAVAAKKDPNCESVRLADAYNMLGDCYQIGGQFNKAIPLFRAASMSRDDDSKAYALISVGSCYMTKGDRLQASVWLRKLIQMGPRGGDWAQAAEAMLVPAGSRRPQMGTIG